MILVARKYIIETCDLALHKPASSATRTIKNIVSIKQIELIYFLRSDYNLRRGRGLCVDALIGLGFGGFFLLAKLCFLLMRHKYCLSS